MSHTPFSKEEKALLAKLRTPIAIQNFLDEVPFNHEKKAKPVYLQEKF